MFDCLECWLCWGSGSARGCTEEMDKDIEGMQGPSNTERLKSLNLFSIKGRLLRSDLRKYWKILCCDLAEFDLSVLLQRSLEERIRHQRLELIMPRCNTDVKRRFFNVRCIEVWNWLPSRVVESGSLSYFKSSLAEFLGDSFNQHWILLPYVKFILLLWWWSQCPSKSSYFLCIVSYFH